MSVRSLLILLLVSIPASAHTCARAISASAYIHLWLAATPLFLFGAGNIYSNILGLIM